MKQRVSVRQAGCHALLAIAAGLLAGCGVDQTNLCGATSAGAASSTGSVQLATPNMQLTMYPGESVAVPVGITAPGGKTTTVSVSGLPSGLTVSPVSVTGSATADLSFTSSVSLATECFVGYTGIFTTTYPMTLTANSTAGTSTGTMLLNVTLQNPSFMPTQINLPRMEIVTDGGVPVVDKTTDIPGDVTITDPTNSGNNYSGSMTIHGHGHSTFLMPKTPYDLKLNSKSSLVGLPSEKSWVLLANYDDKPMLRDYLASELGQMFGMAWTPLSGFVELYFNGQYEGTYQISQKVQIGKNQVNIATLPTTDAPGQDITGGYLLEIDAHRDDTFQMTTPQGLPVEVDDPDPPTPDEEAYIPPVLYAAEDALYSTSFTSPDTGWRAYFDEGSLINWYLVEELMGNQDADFYSSDYLYKDADNPLLYMGPLWDFDTSSGNVWYSPDGNPGYPWVRTQAIWYDRLFQDPSFLADVKARWTAIRPQVGNLPGLVDSGAATLSLAEQNNFARWPNLGQRVWPNEVAEGSYQGEVDFLKQWLTTRIAYMDKLYLN